MKHITFFLRAASLVILHTFAILKGSTPTLILHEDSSLRSSCSQTMQASTRFHLKGVRQRLATFDNNAYTSMQKDEANALQTQLKDWGFFVYCAADNNLHPYARQNIAQLYKQGSSPYAHVVVHHEEFGAPSSKRLYVKKKELAVIQELPRRFEHATGTREALINFYTWAHKAFPSRKQALILWNHGSGIIDPAMFGRSWLPESIPLVYNPHKQLFEYSTEHQDAFNKGVLFNDTFRTYLRNEDLRASLEQIQKNIGGKKIDVVIFDTCHMGMIEIATKIKPYVSWMIASEEVEPGLGIDYTDVINLLGQQNATVENVAEVITTSYAKQFADLFADFTQSAVELANLDGLEIAMQNISTNLKALVEHRVYGKELAGIIKQIRVNKKLATSFYYRDFIDLRHFLTSLQNRFLAIRQDHPAFLTCYQTRGFITQALNTLQSCVRYNVVGCNASEAGGLSIYFPLYNIHNSYRKTVFAEKTGWAGFLSSFIAAIS